MLRVIELFSGIGSQTKALKNIGVDHEVIGVCEIDKYAHKSYEAIHGETLNFGDITKVDRLPGADLWTYSFPCTDLSLAGQQKGMKRGDGTRSGLLWEVERLLKRSTLPKFLLMENVKPLVGEKFLPHFIEWQRFLYSLGYSNYWQVLNAKDYGVPQNRERVFLVSILDGEGYAFPVPVKLEKRLKDVLQESVEEKFYLSEKAISGFYSHKNNHLEKGNGFGFQIVTGNDISKTILSRYYKDGGDCLIKEESSICPTITTSRREHNNHLITNRIRRLTPLECWRLMGFEDSDHEKAAKVNSNTQLYKQAGNSIVVQVLEGIFKNMFQKPSVECVQIGMKF